MQVYKLRPYFVATSVQTWLYIFKGPCWFLKVSNTHKSYCSWL